MSAIRVSGTPNMQMLPGAASTALTANAVVVVTAGALALVASTGSLVSGLCMETRASTDGDYAVARGVLVDLLSPLDVIQMDVTGTLTTGMIGQFLKMSSTAGVVADAGTATDTPAAGLVLYCVGFISATQGLFIVNGLKHTRPAA